MDAGNALDEDRLAGPVVPHEGSHLARRHIEIDADEGLHGAEVLLDAPQSEERLGDGLRIQSCSAPPEAPIADYLGDYLEMPAATHCFSRPLAHNFAASTNPSLTTVEAMLAGVIQIGVSSTDGTCLF